MASARSPLHVIRTAIRPAGMAAAAIALATTVAAATALPAVAAPSISLAEAERQVAALDAKAEAATEQFNASRIALEAAQRRAAGAQADLAREQRAVTQEQRSMSALAASAYRAGGADEIVSLVTTSNPQVFLDQATSLDQLAKSRSAELLRMRTARKRLDAVQDTARQQERQAAALEHQMSSQKAAVQSLLAQQQGVLNQLRAADRARLDAERAAAAERASRSRSLAQAAPAPQQQYVGPASGRVQAAIQEAYRQIGKPYVYGAAGPDSFDCSGLMMWIFARAGISLPHSAAAQYGYGTHVSVSELQPGDMVFYDEGGYIGHVGLYIGGGNMIDAPHTGSYVGIHALYSGLIGGTRL